MDDLLIKKSKLGQVLYEIQSYQHTLFLLTPQLLSELENTFSYFEDLRNAIYDSHMIHLRNIFNFFKNKCKDDDIIYKHILGYEDEIFNTYKEFNLIRNILNKCIQHLTCYRTNEPTIQVNNTAFYYYCYFSSIKNPNFVGLGTVIKEFLYRLQQRDALPIITQKDFTQKCINNLLDRNIFDNKQLLSIKDKYIIIKDGNTIKIVKVEDYRISHKSLD